MEGVDALAGSCALRGAGRPLGYAVALGLPHAPRRPHSRRLASIILAWATRGARAPTPLFEPRAVGGTWDGRAGPGAAPVEQPSLSLPSVPPRPLVRSAAARPRTRARHRDGGNGSRRGCRARRGSVRSLPDAASGAECPQAAPATAVSAASVVLETNERWARRLPCRLAPPLLIPSPCIASCPALFPSPAHARSFEGLRGVAAAATGSALMGGPGLCMHVLVYACR
eukprot:209116-Chlamydomonas_euryale.AAC.2